MYLDRVLFPVTALGPGERVTLWVSGCKRQCPGCANPELWEQHEYQKVNVNVLAEKINKAFGTKEIGITISGGEPFDQADELSELLDLIPQKKDVLVFSGYRHEELQKKEEAAGLLRRIDVLVDGPYIEEQNDNSSALRGSVNQNILFLNEKVRSIYEEYMKKGRTIQNFVYDYKTVSVGIHNRES